MQCWKETRVRASRQHLSWNEITGANLYSNFQISAQHGSTDDIAREQVFRCISDNYNSTFRLSLKSFLTERTLVVGFLNIRRIALYALSDYFHTRQFPVLLALHTGWGFPLLFYCMSLSLP